LFSCKKTEQENGFNVTFWTNESVPWNLYIDGKLYGTLKQPYYVSNESQIPDCGDDDFSNTTLSPGQHEYYLQITIMSDTFTSPTHYFEVNKCTVLRIIQ